MFIAAARLTLDFYGNDDLSKKHSEMRRLVTELGRKFNVSAHEVSEDVDDPERCVLGLALVASSHVKARSLMDNVVAHADSIAFARVTTQDVDVSQFL